MGKAKNSKCGGCKSCQKSFSFCDGEYLIAKFDDVDTANEITRRSKAFKEINGIVESLSTKKDEMHVYKAYETSCTWDGEKTSGIDVCISFGLNGPGKQTDYLSALRKLLATKKFHIFDAYVDYIDDVYLVWAFYRQK